MNERPPKEFNICELSTNKGGKLLIMNKIVDKSILSYKYYLYIVDNYHIFAWITCQINIYLVK